MSTMSAFRCSPSPHQADDHTGACQRWGLAAFLLFGARHGERTRVAHVVPGGLDPAVGTLDVRDAELVDMAVEGIGDAAHVPPDADRILIERDRCRIAHLRDAGAVEIETQVVGAGILVIGADDVAPAAVPERAPDVMLQPVVGPVEVRSARCRRATN